MATRKFPDSAALTALLRAEPTLTRRDLMMLYDVRGPCVDRNLRKIGAWAAKDGHAAWFEADHPERVPALEQRIRKMHAANPDLTVADIQSEFSITKQSAGRAVRKAGVKLRSSNRILPNDEQLKKEIKELGQNAVAAKYGVTVASVSQHAARLGLRATKTINRPALNRRLPPDDVLAHEFGLFTPREIAIRHGVTYQTVLEARVRLGVQAQSARMPHALIPSGMTSIIANAIAHLSTYREALSATDPPRARALLADIEQLGTVASTIRTIATMVADPRTAS